MACVFQSLVLYRLYPFFHKQLDELVKARSPFYLLIRRDGQYWRCECHVVNEQSVDSIVLTVVDGGDRWESHFIQTLVPVLLCLCEVGRLQAVAIEGHSRVGHAVALITSPRSPIVLGLFTWGRYTTISKRLSLAVSRGSSVLEFWITCATGSCLSSEILRWTGCLSCDV